MTTEAPVRYLTESELEAGLDDIRLSPATNGKLEGIVIRPAANERVVLKECAVSPEGGIHGDRWAKTSKGDDIQVTLMNARAAQLIAQSPERWPLAGDQLYVDLDLSEDNLPPGTQLMIGSALFEITAKDHTGCTKFSSRFGSDAYKFVNSKEGAWLNLRGIYAKVLVAGTIHVGDPIRKVQ
jgi:MOSC domain-containing protein YiiM